MPSLSDRLKSLGVQVGSDDLKPQQARRFQSVRDHLGGEVMPTERGEAYVVAERYPAEHRIGSAPLWGPAPLDVLATWAGEPAIARLEAPKFAFLDTETTGLSGGAGTFAFMIGIGKFDDNGFQLAQFFLREPGEEPAQLAAVVDFLAGCEALVSFNGKSFDVPILNSRFTLHHQPPPVKGFAHLDLLHLARKLWRRRLPSRRLGDLEVEILGAERSQEDVPGYEAPIIYREYLNTGDAQPLKGLFYHNAMDILSMAALMNHISELLTDPEQAAADDLDLLSIGRLHEDLGQVSEAQSLYTTCLGRPLNQKDWLEAAERLSFIYKRAGDWDAALKLWRVAAERGEVYAHVELAKYFEHRSRKLEEALRWTQAALDLIGKKGFPIVLRYQWQEALEHRRDRLQRKLESN
jgi:uncharacterized protein YprB with RNaseH-like and TPR domain